MKKVLLDFNKVHYYMPTRNGIAREMRTRHNFGAQFRSGGTEGDDDDDDDDETKGDQSEKLIKKINTRVSKLLKGKADAETVTRMQQQLTFLVKGKNEKGEDVDSPFPIEELRAMADPKNGAMAKLVEMGVKIQEFETAQRNAPKDMSIRAQVSAWQEKNKAQIDKIVAGEKVDIPALELRVASPMLVSTVNAGNSPYIGRVEVESGINDFLRFPNTFWDFIKKGRTGAPTYVWVNKTNPLGAAAFIGPGVAKPGISFELAAENSIAKKVADSLKCGTELLQDIDGMTSFIEDELRAQVMIAVNTKLMTGVSSTTVPAGIQTLSQNFAFYTDAAANIKTTNPTYMDAIRAAVAALRSGKLTGPITVFVNSIDAANMDLSKAVDSGVYLLPPFSTQSGQRIAGAQIVEDPNIPVGYFQAAFLQYYRILIYKDFTVSWGWEMDDFIKNLVTAVGEMRLHQFFNSIYTGAFLYDTFENVVTAITKV